MAQNNREKYAYLDQLSTQQLEQLLLADAEDDSGRDTSEVILHILEVLQHREDSLTAQPVDVDRAWEEFQSYYNTPEGEGQTLYPHKEAAKTLPPVKKRFPALWRTARIAAATVAVLFALMVGAQASGLNVFGALAQWTSETFHFGNRNQSENLDLFISSLAKYDISEELVPALTLKGFYASKPEIWNDDTGVFLQLPFYSEDKSSFYTISIERYNFQEKMEQMIFEKDNLSVETYVTNSKTFYIFSNLGTTTATWADGVLTEKIWGNISMKDIKAILDSIGEL